MNYTDNQNNVYENNDALKFILRNQLSRITLYIILSVLGFILAYYFLLSLNINGGREWYIMIWVFSFWIVFLKIENLRVLTVFKSLRILSLVDSKEIKWGIQDDELTFGKGRYTIGYDSYPVKQLNCFFDNEIVTIKPIIDFQPTNLQPLEV
jgi:hypothetical protein